MSKRENKQKRHRNEEKQKPTEETTPKVPERETGFLRSLFPHMPILHKKSSEELLRERGSPDDDKYFQRSQIHPSLLQYALQTAQRLDVDEDTRTIAFLSMMLEQIEDEPIGESDKPCVKVHGVIERTSRFLKQIAQTPIGVGNAIRFLNGLMDFQKTGTMTAEALKERVKVGVENFINEKVNEVAKFIEVHTAGMISDGDVILTYGYSPTICQALLEAAKTKRFKVIVVDSRPNFDARRVVEEISKLDVRYILISGLSYVIPEVTKVIIEAYGILSNDAAQTPIGTSMIAMVAHEAGVPVILTCSSYRFVTSVRIDSLSKNQILGEEYIKPISVPTEGVEYFVMTYDVTPGDFVDMVICEPYDNIGAIPVKSISTNVKLIQDYYMFAKSTKKKSGEDAA